MFLDLGVGEDRGVFIEVGREVGVEAVAERVAVGGEEVEDLVAVAQPPLAGRSIEGKAVGFNQIEGGGVAALFT